MRAQPSLDFGRGLAAFLNSTLVDEFFRQFNGHTQVNAGDLRGLRYPDADALVRLGTRVGEALDSCGGQLDQNALDAIIEQELFGMAEASNSGIDPVVAKRRILEAREVLGALGLPKAQTNDRSAMALLAIVDLPPGTPWSNARERKIGITPIMDYIRQQNGRECAPNTRETFRRFTVHQFEQAGLVLRNPDNPQRPPNSPDYGYQIERSALQLLRTFGTGEWEQNLQAYVASRPTLVEKCAQERDMQRIPLTLPDGEELTISPGGQNELIERIVHEFCPRWARGGHLLYLGDAEDKWAVNRREELAALGVHVDEHGRCPA